MSSTLFWQPVAPPNNTLSVPTKLWFRAMFGSPVDTNLKGEQIPLLNAAIAATSDEEVKKELEDLVEAVILHDTIRVFEGNW